jgi:hypothetical protein
VSILDFIIIEFAFFVLWHYVLNMSYNVPKGFMLCQNASCSKADSCLRNRCYKELTLETESVKVLNPGLYPKENENCQYYKTTEKVRYAWGLKAALSKLPYETANNIKRQLITRFGQTKYYRFCNEVIPIKEKDQLIIKHIFLENDINADPDYARFTEELVWFW